MQWNQGMVGNSTCIIIKCFHDDGENIDAILFLKDKRLYTYMTNTLFGHHKHLIKRELYIDLVINISISFDVSNNYLNQIEHVQLCVTTFIKR